MDKLGLCAQNDRVLNDMQKLKKKNASFLKSKANSKQVIKTLSEHIPIIIKEVEMLQTENEELKANKIKMKDKYQEAMRKKKSYKQKLRRFQQKCQEDEPVRNGEECVD